MFFLQLPSPKILLIAFTKFVKKSFLQTIDDILSGSPVMVRDQTVAIINMRGYSHMGLRSGSDVQKRKEGGAKCGIHFHNGRRKAVPAGRGRKGVIRIMIIGPCL